MAITLDQLTTPTLFTLIGTSRSARPSIGVFAASLSAELQSQRAAQIASRLPARSRTLLRENALAGVVNLARQSRSLFIDRALGSPLFSRSLFSGNDSAISGTAVDFSAKRNFAITVFETAAAKRVVSDELAANDAQGFGSGTRDFRLTALGNDFDFTVDLDATTTNADVLQAVADEFNAAVGSGVSAEVVTDETTGDSTLRVFANRTGEALDFSLTDQSGGTLLADLGLDDTVAADTDAGTGGVLVAARDAQFSLDQGAVITSASNEIDLFNDTVTITLNETTGGEAVNLQVRSDTEPVEQAIRDFVGSLNAVFDFVTTNPSSLTSTLAQQLNMAIEGQLANLRRIGITRDADGLLEIDTTRLQEAIESDTLDIVLRPFTNASGLAITTASIADDFLTAPQEFLSQPRDIENIRATQAVISLQASEVRGLLIDVLL